jgi:hypothetical protein
MSTQLRHHVPARAPAAYVVTSRATGQVRGSLPRTADRADGWDWLRIATWLALLMLSLATWSGVALLLARVAS